MAARRDLRAVALWCLLGTTQEVSGQTTRPSPPPPATAAPGLANEERERQVVERFVALLEKSPRRGTSLDRVYGYHVERGTLDALLATYRDRTAKDPKDGAAWMILGLLEAQRGRDAAAVAAYRLAETARPTDPMAPYYLGQTLVLVGQPDDAIAAFERAIALRPPRNELLEVFQALGRVHQRARHDREALAAWGRLEALFPNDARVQEQIATTLAEEGQLEDALKRYEALAGTTRDAYRKVQHRLTAADLKVRLGRSEPALADFEAILGQVRPDSWLARDVRRKIENVFLRNDDLNGLTTYYEKRLEREPDDVEALERLGRTLAQLGRTAESLKRLEKATTLAPTRRDLRLGFIDILVQERDFAKAGAQYAELDRLNPGDPDTLRAWGSMLLRDPGRPEAERKQAAATVWRKLLERKPDDPLATAQVADLLRQAGFVEEALTYYRKAVALAPTAPQYHEYLGEYLYTLGRKDEARAAWAELAAGANRTPANLDRLSEVLAGFGEIATALETAAAAIGLDGESFPRRLNYATLLARSGDHDAALAQLDVADRLVEGPEQAEAALRGRLASESAAGRLEARITALRADLDAGREANAAGWSRLARYQEAASRLPEALAATARAVEVEPQSSPAWSLRARLAEAAGRLGEAADARRHLAEVDRRGRPEHLAELARIEARLGRREQALAAGRELLTAAPGNADHYRLFADLCFQLGEDEEGFETLRRALRVNPTDLESIRTLAEALAARFRTDEAIELYWRAFERSDDLDGKIGVVGRLTDLYLQRNQLDVLLGRLERLRNEPNAGRRETTLCLAQAFASSGDLGTARQELESLLAENARDTQLLQQLSRLAEQEGDLEQAAGFMEQMVAVAPSDDLSGRLAELFLRAGEVEKAGAIYRKLADDARGSPDRTLDAIDRLLASGKAETALELAAGLLRRNPRDWEAMIREASALAQLRRRDEAAARCRALLALDLPDNDGSAAIKVRLARSTARTAGLPTAPAASRNVIRRPIQERTQAAYYVRMTTGLDPESASYASRSSGTGRAWSPGDFGQARLLALGHLLFDARRQDGGEAVLLAPYLARATAGDPRAQWDLYYLEFLRGGQGKPIFDAALQLARSRPDDLDAQFVLITALPSRLQVPGVQMVAASNSAAGDNVPALPAEDLETVLRAHRALRQRQPDALVSQTASYVRRELLRAGRTDEADAMYRETVDSARQAEEVYAASALAAERGDIEALLDLDRRREQLEGNRSGGPVVSYYAQPNAASFQRAINVRAKAKAYDDVLRLLDSFLAGSRRQAERNAARPASRAASAAAASLSARNRVTVMVEEEQRSVQIDFPAANDVLDAGTLSVLRTVFELYKRADLVSDLLAHTREVREAAPEGPARVQAGLVDATVRWWDERPDEAEALLHAVVEPLPSDAPIWLVAAELAEVRGDPREALDRIDHFEPIDNAAMQNRETMALRLAVGLGDVERARRAAERLFGLRLDTETQLTLVGQMQQLGMNDLAEAVLARVQRRAGSQIGALIVLMQQYQRQGRPEVAAQVARQILRRSSASLMNPAMRRSYTTFAGSAVNDEMARQSALQVLAQTGQLEETIARTKAQIERSPTSVPLHLALADYTRVANRREESRAALRKVVELRPDDAQLRLQLATQMLREGQPAEAIEHFKLALDRDPSLMGNQYTTLYDAYRQAGKLDELAKWIDGVDLRKLGESYYVASLARNLIADPKTRPVALRTFQRLATTFPNDRNDWLSTLNFSDPSIWREPGMTDLAIGAILPPEGANVSPWYGLDGGSFSMSGGVIETSFSRSLDQIARQGQLESLRRRVQSALEKTPTWTGGRAILAMIEAREGHAEAARAALEPLLSDPARSFASSSVTITIVREIERVPDLRDLAIRAYDDLIEGRRAGGSNDYYRDHALRRLVAMYRADGRKEDARKLLVELAGFKPLEMYADPSESLRAWLSAVVTTALELLDLGYPVDAARVLHQALSDTGLNQSLAANSASLQTETAQVRSLLTRAIDAVDPGALVSDLTQQIERPARAEGEKAGGSTRPLVDLLLMVHPQTLESAKVRSLVAEALSRRGKVEHDLAPEVKTSIDRLRLAHPEDLNLAVVDALVAVGEAEGPISSPPAALARLLDQVASTPLEPIPAGDRPNARQRAEAARQLPLWLVARACVQHESLHAAAELLSARAIEAANRQNDPLWSLAILREQSEQSLARGDRAAAEAYFRQMLERVLTREKTRSATPPAAASPGPAPIPTPRPVAPSSPRGAEPKASPRALQAPATAPGRGTPPSGSGPPGPVASVPPLTRERFEMALDISLLAARQEMSELSMRAVREALAGGPPLMPASVGIRPGMPTRIMRADQAEAVDPIPGLVERRVAQVEGVWRTAGVPAAAIEAVLRGVVLPAHRPGEVFLYPRPLDPASLKSTHSLGALLAARAAECGRAAELKESIAARSASPLAGFPARVLLVLLAIQAGEGETAAQELATLARQLERETSRANAELGSHAALSALSLAPAAANARAVLRAAIETLDRNGSNYAASASVPAGLRRHLARLEFAAGDTAAGRRWLEGLVASQERASSLNNGNSSIAAYYTRGVLLQVATELARAGLLSETLEALGTFHDAPTYVGGDPPIGATLAAIQPRLLALPARERYEALKAWVLPVAPRTNLRLLAAFAPAERGSNLIDPTTSSTPPAASSPILDTATWLVTAAQEAGTLDDLAAALGPLVERGAENAAVMNRLVQIARGEVEPVAAWVRERIAERDRTIEPSTPAGTTRAAPFLWPDWLVTRALLAGDASRGPGLDLAHCLERDPANRAPSLARSALRRMIAEAEAARAGDPAAGAGLDPGLGFWIRTGPVGPSVSDRATGSGSPIWIAHAGHVAQIVGPTRSVLVSRVPLAGTFTFSFDIGPNSIVETNPPLEVEAGGYAGLVLAHTTGTISTQGGVESLSRPEPPSRPGGIDHVSIEVQPERLRFRLNGSLVYEESDPPATSPWLTLPARGDLPTYWRNLRIEGQPSIPREVRLTKGDQLEGWSGRFYGESQPLRRAAREKTARSAYASTVSSSYLMSQNLERRVSSTIRPEEHDWWAKDGVIHGGLGDGRRASGAGNSSSTVTPEFLPGWLSYHRPLGDGETLSYEFLYEPGRTEVHPTLGRVAILLGPEGARLRWLSPIGDVLAPDIDNARPVPEAQRVGEPALPLKDGEWNAMTLAASGDTVTFSLNGRPFLRRPIELDGGALFGFYHDRARTTSQVRNVVLRGDWPESLPAGVLADLLRPAGATAADAARLRAAHAVIGEDVFLQGADAILEAARGLSAAERFEHLAAWVLPGPDHPTFRLAGTFAPTNPIPDPDAPTAAAGARRIEQGGQLEAPAMELVATAEGLQRLDDLLERVEKAEATSDPDRRGRLALLALVQAARGDEARATESLEALKPLLAALSPDEPATQRWPELVAAVGVRDRRSTLAKPALDLLQTMVEQEGSRSHGAAWELRVRHEAARAQGPGTPGADPAIPGWSRVTHGRAESRANGWPLPLWASDGPQWTHVPGHADDLLYLNVPLRGSFEVEAEIAARHGLGLGLVYAGQAVRVSGDGKRVERTEFGRPPLSSALDPPLTPSEGGWVRWRMTVADGTLTTYANDRKIEERHLTAPLDPWLVLLARGSDSGSVRGLRITGAPVVPETLTLSEQPGLIGWLTEEAAPAAPAREATGGTPAPSVPPWARQGEEIVGARVPDVRDRSLPRLLRYHRPLLEDGEISYEFYHDPAETLVHPALDRLVFLLEPEGVALRWLTDSPHDRGRLPVENRTVEASIRRGPKELPLKPREWNELTLSLEGDLLSLRLNGQLVAERALEPTNQRTFGLYHDAASSAARVRAVRYRGSWPRELPDALRGPAPAPEPIRNPTPP